MQRGIEKGEFIEWAEFSGNMYGTRYAEDKVTSSLLLLFLHHHLHLSSHCSKKAVADVQKSGKVCVLDIDMQGVRSMKKTDLNPVFIFVKAPSMTELVREHRTSGT